MARFVAQHHRVDDDVARHEALDGRRQQDRQAEQDSHHIHQDVVVTVVLQQVAYIIANR